jgi:hypothetical protein
MWIREFHLLFWKRSGIYHVGVNKIANYKLRIANVFHLRFWKRSGIHFFKVNLIANCKLRIANVIL